MNTLAATLLSATSSERLGSKFMAALVAASAVVALYAGRRIFIPLGAALLLALVLAPLVTELRRLRFARVTSVLAAIALAAAAMATIALFLTAEFAQLASALPARRTTAVALPILAQFSQPLPVWVASGLAEPLLNPLTSAAIAILFAAFFLLHKDELAGRVVRFAATGDPLRKRAAIGWGARELGRHLLRQGSVDLGFGAVIALGLWSIGVPNPGLWALLGAMLRAVPFVGVPVAALCPLMLAVALDPTALLICETLLLFLVADCVARLAERRVLGPLSPRLRAAPAVVATVCWTCLWGMTGLLLAMPLTLCAVVLGRHFETLKFLDDLLAGPATATAARGASARTVSAWNGDPVLRALLLAQRELGARECDARRLTRLEAELAAWMPLFAPRDEYTALALRPWNLAPQWQTHPVLCVAGPGRLDEAAAALLAQAMTRKGLSSRVVPFDRTLPANLPRLDFSGVQIACFCCLDPRDYAGLRQMVRRVRPRAASVSTIAGLWGWEGNDLADAGTVECDLVSIHPQRAAQQIALLARKAAKAPSAPVAPLAQAA